MIQIELENKILKFNCVVKSCFGVGVAQTTSLEWKAKVFTPLIGQTQKPMTTISDDFRRHIDCTFVLVFVRILCATENESKQRRATARGGAGGRVRHSGGRRRALRPHHVGALRTSRPRTRSRTLFEAFFPRFCWSRFSEQFDAWSFL